MLCHWGEHNVLGGHKRKRSEFLPDSHLQMRDGSWNNRGLTYFVLLHLKDGRERRRRSEYGYATKRWQRELRRPPSNSCSRMFSKYKDGPLWGPDLSGTVSFHNLQRFWMIFYSTQVLRMNYTFLRTVSSSLPILRSMKIKISGSFLFVHQYVMQPQVQLQSTWHFYSKLLCKNMAHTLGGGGGKYYAPTELWGSNWKKSR